MTTLRPLVISSLFLTAATLRADWKDDAGYTRLRQTFTSGVPTGVSGAVGIAPTGGVSQIEAGSGGNSYLPLFENNPEFSNNPLFTDKTLYNQSAGTGTSGHATAVAANYYGNTRSLIPTTISISSYDASGWLNADFLNYGQTSVPKIEARRVHNHSWIGSALADQVTHIGQRYDYAVDRDGFVGVAGVNNGSANPVPHLMAHAYHVISVGLVSGNHSAGLTEFDGSGRMKPDLVAFAGETSYSTPQVASAAGLVSEKLRNTSYTPALTAADYPRLTKALLLAGAAKEPLTSWSRASTAAPYDTRFGAGALNLLLSYRILAAGKQSPSTDTLRDPSGWSVASASATSPHVYLFEVPAGTASTRFSAALCWHRNVITALGRGLTPTRTWTTTLADLDLKLFNVTGTALGAEVDASLSRVDNLEHLYQVTLAPGRYALQVSFYALSPISTATPYALAWRTSPTVTVAASAPIARELDGSAATFTLTRTGPTTSPLFVPLAWSGTATAGTHYATPATSVLIPAGASTATVQITPVADSIAQGDRTVVLSVATDYSLSAGAPASGIVTIADKPFDAWRFSNFTSLELASSHQSGDNADPDGDGLSNLLEYALNADPKTPDAPTRAPTVGAVADRLTLTYSRPTYAPDITYTVEWSADLQTWSSGPAVTETVGATDNGNGTSTIVVRSLPALNTSTRQFLRLHVTRP